VGAGESIEAVQEAFELTRDQVPLSALRSAAYVAAEEHLVFLTRR